MTENMRIMKIYEAFGARGGMNLFCGHQAATKQIFRGAFWQKCLILPHNPHNLGNCLTSTPENMRIMRIYEEGLFNGFYLPCILGGFWSRPFYEAFMRNYEEANVESSYFGLVVAERSKHV